MMSRNGFRAGVLGMLGCAAALAYTPAVLGIGLLEALGQGAESGPTLQSPVLRNAAQEPVGFYGGVVSAYTRSGELQSATLLILPTGYVMPVLHDGETATFSMAYYEKDGCEGREFLATTGTPGSLLPARGMVYRSPSVDTLAYIAKDAQPQAVPVRSRWALGKDGQCEVFVQTQSLFGTRPNETAVTGVDAVVGTGPLSLAVEQTRTGRPRAEKSPEQPRNVRGVTEDSPADAAMDETLPECSPGCLMEAVGNGVCDIACYYPACNHDGGDCAAMQPDELAQELAQMCVPGCKRADIGDGFCDAACQTDACDQDGGDCAQSGDQPPE